MSRSSGNLVSYHRWDRLDRELEKLRCAVRKASGICLFINADTEKLVDRMDIETESVSGEVSWVPCSDARATWIGMGIALHQYFDGEDVGLLAWYDWSRRTDNDGHGQLLDRWETFTATTPEKLPYFRCSFSRTC